MNLRVLIIFNKENCVSLKKENATAKIHNNDEEDKPVYRSTS
jgi:hypothetical protein